MGPAVAGDVTWDVTFSSKRPTRILYVVLGMSWKNIWVTGGGYNKTIISSLHAQRFAPPGTTAMVTNAPEGFQTLWRKIQGWMDSATSVMLAATSLEVTYKPWGYQMDTQKWIQ